MADSACLPSNIWNQPFQPSWDVHSMHPLVKSSHWHLIPFLNSERILSRIPFPMVGVVITWQPRVGMMDWGGLILPMDGLTTQWMMVNYTVPMLGERFWMKRDVSILITWHWVFGYTFFSLTTLTWPMFHLFTIYSLITGRLSFSPTACTQPDGYWDNGSGSRSYRTTWPILGKGKAVVICGSPGETSNDFSLGVVDGFSPKSWGPRSARREIYKDGVFTEQKYNAWFHIALRSKDQLRQRVAWALYQILPVSSSGGFDPRTEHYMQYYDIYVRHAFGSYRSVLKEISYTTLMVRLWEIWSFAFFTKELLSAWTKHVVFPLVFSCSSQKRPHICLSLTMRQFNTPLMEVTRSTLTRTMHASEYHLVCPSFAFVLFKLLHLSLNFYLSFFSNNPTNTNAG